MKTVLSSFLLLLLISDVAQQKTIAIYSWIDMTDPNLISTHKEKAEKIPGRVKTRYGLNTKAIFNFFTIDGESITNNKQAEIIISPDVSWFTASNQKEGEWKRGIKVTKERLKSIKSEKVPGGTRIFENVQRELARLQNTEANIKKAVIFSDLIENSEKFTFYGEIHRKFGWPLITKENYKEEAKKFVLKGTKGIDFHAVRSTDEISELTDLAEKFWVLVFENSGACLEVNSIFELSTGCDF